MISAIEEGVESAREGDRCSQDARGPNTVSACGPCRLLSARDAGQGDPDQHGEQPRTRLDLFPRQEEWQIIRDTAQDLVTTGFLTGIKTPAQAFHIILMGRELGVGPVTALGSINIINGKPSCSAELMQALIYRDHGDNALIWDESTNEVATLSYSRRTWPGRKVHSFSMTDAKRAGLSGPNWTKYPASMLRARCVSAVARMAFSDVISGLSLPEEVGTLEDGFDGFLPNEASVGFYEDTGQGTSPGSPTNPAGAGMPAFGIPQSPPARLPSNAVSRSASGPLPVQSGRDLGAGPRTDDDADGDSGDDGDDGSSSIQRAGQDGSWPSDRDVARATSAVRTQVTSVAVVARAEPVATHDAAEDVTPGQRESLQRMTTRMQVEMPDISGHTRESIKAVIADFSARFNAANTVRRPQSS